MKCKICEKECKNFIGIVSHISRTHNISSKEYYDKYLKNENEGVCLECRKETNYKNISKGYGEFCSYKCSTNSKLTREKYKKTNIERYGVENPTQNKEVKEKIKQTNLEKYGVEYNTQRNEIKEKKKKTNLKKYGVEYGLQNKEVQEKGKQTCVEKYGVEYSTQNEKIKEKKKITCLKNHGVEYPGQNKKIREKQKQTNLNNFLPKVKEILEYNNLELLSDYNKNRKLIKVQCKICNNIFETQYFYIQQRNNSRCPVCFPGNRSGCEIELSNFIKSLNLNIIENSKNIIKPYELDIFIPSKNIAIEFDGLYWHSENKIDKYYHLNKTELCEKNNIQLIHIFEDEWLFKQDIVKSRLKQLLKLNNSQKINTSECIIKEISIEIKNEFLEKYHIQGEDNSNIKLGAFYNDELISIMTFSKDSELQNNIYELSRFCSNYNYYIPNNIFSKLLSHFKNNYKYKEIFSFSDRRWCQENLYYKLGFEFDYFTNPNYFYIKDLKRIHKDISESILREQEDYYRIWDCGHLKFKLKGI